MPITSPAESGLPAIPAFNSAISQRAAIGDGFVFIESKLKGVGEGKWAVGEQMTAVDAFLLVFWRWGSLHGFGMESYPRYRALMEMLVVKEVVKETLRIEEIEAML